MVTPPKTRRRLPGKGPYVWQRPQWPAWSFDEEQVAAAIDRARRLQGLVEGKALAIGIGRDGEMATGLFSQEVLATAAIEGEKLDPAAVRSSVMRRMGLADEGPRDRHVDGLVEVISDAITSFATALDHDRLHRWQSALFPGGTRGITRIAVGRYRDHADPMQIVSGTTGREKVRYEAPPSRRVRQEMSAFLKWFAATAPKPGKPPALNGLARAALAHLWFETIHPFEDGNGRIGRAIVDMALAQDMATPVRLYSLSRQLLERRGDYYDALNAAQRGTGDATEWVVWFVRQMEEACRRSVLVIDAAIERSRFWHRHGTDMLTPRQRRVLQRLLDAGDGGFLGGLNAEKYMKMTGVSKATATRDLSHMTAAGLLWTRGKGKALRYYIDVPGWQHAEPAAA